MQILTNTPFVTVVIPVYNRAQYIREAVDSILAQTWTNFELFVIDDGSTDGTRERLRSYGDPRLRLVCNATNLGVPTTRNRGIDLACGEYLAFLDSDDWASPDRLAKQVAFLERHTEVAAVGAWVAWMDEHGRALKRIKRKPISSDEIAAARLFQSGIENSASMARTVILRDYRHCADSDVSEDFDLWARIAAHHRLANLPEVLVRRRMHSGRITQAKAHRAQGRRQAIYATQLRTLGVAFTDTDLECHFLLRSMRKREFRPDLAYLTWADDWLQRLHAANQQVRCYPEPAFSELLGRMWGKVCWYIAPGYRRAAWQRFWRSPLRNTTWHAWRRRFTQYTRPPSLSRSGRTW